MKTWRTKSLGLAAYLSMIYPVLEREWRGDTCYWIFEDTPEAQAAARIFFDREAMVPAFTYFEAAEKLRRELVRELRAKRAG